MSIKERLNAIAEALETASKQARLLAEEVDRSCEVTTDSICAAQDAMNRRVGAQAKRDNPRESQP